MARYLKALWALCAIISVLIAVFVGNNIMTVQRLKGEINSQNASILESQVSTFPTTQVSSAALNHYQVLGVADFIATDDEIKSAYMQHMRSLLSRPNHNKEEIRKMFRMNEAYQVLINGRDRCWYDFQFSQDQTQYAECQENVSKKRFEEFQKMKRDQEQGEVKESSR
ncbi:hypothetical protein F4779DRAFT_561466, partial [Xylariaceae sp. FL0662B]